jgi:hypothetical protein
MTEGGRAGGPVPWTGIGVRGRFIALAILVALVVVVAALATIPVSKSYTFGDDSAVESSEPSSFAGSLNQTLCPTGAMATLSLAISGDLNATFKMLNPSGATLWGPESTSATTMFTLICGVYSFDWSGFGMGSLGFTGSVAYSAPILSSPEN